MDVGIFMRSKLQLGLWIAVPLVLIALLQIAVSAYTRNTEAVLKESGELLEVMPEMEARLASAQSVIGRFAMLSQGEMESSEVIRKRVADAGQSSRFNINSLSVTRNAAPDTAAGATSKPGAALAVGTVSASVSGDGGLRALINFLNAVQGGEHLVVIESATVRSSRLVADALYSADFVLKYYVLGP